MNARASLAALALLAPSLSACGGGAPLLHPAHTLPEGDVDFAAGTSGRFALGGLRDAERALDAAASERGGARSDAERARFVEGAIARFAVGPGVAPFVSARVGLGHHNEGGFTYTGRGVRIDGRHAFEWPNLALSIGAAASGALARPGDQPKQHVGDAPGADTGLRTASLTSLNGYGLELPVLFGYRSSADVVKLWAGLRVGVEHDSFDVTLVESPDSAVGSRGSATQLWGGGLAGFSVGLAPIEVRVEVDAAYARVHGKLLTYGGDLSGTVAGWSLTPAMAISAKF
ncbi:MAG TPA: hypothetical protein VHP33_09420 [Polyangiaceae bacterium]|nr:hypothetical protein [Polyangiaceae bacterium]